MKAHLITIGVFALLGLFGTLAAIFPQYVMIFLIGTLFAFLIAGSYWCILNSIRWDILREDDNEK